MKAKTKQCPSRSTLPRDVQRIRRRYVRVVRQAGPDWSTYLEVDHQGFSIVTHTTKERAIWFGDMLAIALQRMIKANNTTRNEHD